MRVLVALLYPGLGLRILLEVVGDDVCSYRFFDICKHNEAITLHKILKQE